jgi:hypothetical protein
MKARAVTTKTGKQSLHDDNDTNNNYTQTTTTATTPLLNGKHVTLWVAWPVVSFNRVVPSIL